LPPLPFFNDLKILQNLQEYTTAIELYENLVPAYPLWVLSLLSPSLSLLLILSIFLFFLTPKRFSHQAYQGIAECLLAINQPTMALKSIKERREEVGR
jgi:hypothetical protein